MEKNVTINIGNLVSGLLLVAFIVLKLCHVIEWSWLWVLAPLWIPVAIALVFIVIAFIITRIR